MIKSRNLILALILIFLAFFLFGCNNSTEKVSTPLEQTETQPKEQAEKVELVVLKLGHILAPTDPLNGGTEKFAELVKQKTNGTMEIKVFPASQLGTAPQQIEGVRLGSQDMFVGAMAWYEDMKGLEGFRMLGVPSAFDSNEHIQKFLESQTGQSMLKTMKDQYGLEAIVYNWNRPPRQVMSSKVVKDRADVKGIKIRVPEQETWVGSWKALGANPTPIAWSEIYTSLQQNVIEAVEAPIALIYSSKFQEQVKNLTLTNHTFMNIGVVINSKVFNKLNKEQQTAIIEAANEAAAYQNELYAKAEVDNLEKMKEAGVTVYEVDRAKFFEPVEQFAREMEEKGKWQKGLWDEVRNLAR